MENHRYDDIINLPHHQSATHRHMSMIDRAAQFSPFAALTGYDACIHEAARATDRRMELDEDAKAALSEKLTRIQTQLAGLPRGVVPGIRIEYFVPDTKKAGGAYRTMTGCVKNVDDITHTITFADGIQVPMEDIVALEGDIFKNEAVPPAAEGGY